MTTICKAAFVLALLSLAAAQERGGTLNAAWAQNPVGLDPHTISAMSSFQVLENVLDTLVTRPDVRGYEARPDQAIRFGETWLDR